MRSFFIFIQRYHFFLLFLLLETFALYFVINNFSDKKEKFINTTDAVSSYLLGKFTFVNDYLHLREDNIKLAEENAKFRNIMRTAFKENIVTEELINDSLYSQQYHYIHARVINNSIQKNHNFITLDKGMKHGIKPEMVVISPRGVVGVVRDVSENYATVISVLNVELGISSKVKKNNYFGSLVWNGRNYTIASLKDIPNHVNISIGDTIITSGYSALFPEGILIGTINDYRRNPGGSFYDINVKLAVDFKRISHVYVVDNFLKKEQKELEEQTENRE